MIYNKLILAGMVQGQPMPMQQPFPVQRPMMVSQDGQQWQAVAPGTQMNQPIYNSQSPMPPQAMQQFHGQQSVSSKFISSSSLSYLIMTAMMCVAYIPLLCAQIIDVVHLWTSTM